MAKFTKKHLRKRMINKKKQKKTRVKMYREQMHCYMPKGAQADFSNSDMYRSIAISSLLSKIFDNIIIERQQDFLSILIINLALKQNHQQSYVQLW